jgi:hypothetical protein
MTSARARTLKAPEVLRIIMDTSCGHCDYDEAEGGLISHCHDCARKVLATLCRRAMIETNEIITRPAAALKVKRK